MPATLTLKNIPDEVYERLKASAETHRRSLNSEAIVCLKSVLEEPAVRGLFSSNAIVTLVRSGPLHGGATPARNLPRTSQNRFDSAMPSWSAACITSHRFVPAQAS